MVNRINIWFGILVFLYSRDKLIKIGVMVID